MGNQKRDVQGELIEFIAGFARDPYGFVLAAYPWGEGELKDHDGPEEWQATYLKAIRDGLMTVTEAIQTAVASGHGVGKSALVAWLIDWAMSTMEDTRGVVTANTENQLKTKTWAELGKWRRLSITKDWFHFTATALFSTEKDHEKTWRIDMVPWSENNTEAFAGLHNQGKRILVVFDEGSAIPDVIWEVTEGALTDEGTEIIWATFGNPTRNTGRFRECFGKYRHRWRTQKVDARTVKLTNKAQLQKWIDDYGLDSDFVKVRVLGEFPSQGDRQFISSALVDAARGKHLRVEQYGFAPVIITLDPAWTGGDEIAIMLRQGLRSQLLATYPFNDNDLELAGYLARFEDEHQADGVFIDQGYGTGIYSAGKTMGRNWQLVSFGSASPEPGYVNLRAYMWGKVKEWLKEGGALPDDQVLCDDLIGPEYIVKLDGRILLESKDDMKKRGLASPNRGDALAMTFAYPVTGRRRDALGVAQPKVKTKYDVLNRRRK